eukprot:TRINITY_DN12867_c0_g1_i1.p1 TRINITY_DN12867_c0_g1~~TRINITY_DN12867_c0_g1_i1.p1  ORF type:complete len:120 (-),score=27.47 TRINITY_DN12867_c0_g1_i1:409-744(-)
MDRQHRLEQLPEEPPEGESETHMVTVVLPLTGRRLSRRWRSTDSIMAVANFAFASGTEDELPFALKLPKLVRSFPKCQLWPRTSDELETLGEIGMSSREVVHVLLQEAVPE